MTEVWLENLRTIPDRFEGRRRYFIRYIDTYTYTRMDVETIEKTRATSELATPSGRCKEPKHKHYRRSSGQAAEVTRKYISLYKICASTER